eukprot:c7789_g1_i1.p1 GENE.c7789_g1_i1~~c7789_g1_i1.p1  ORF type:complete len:281 (-),score=50.18 c7789_g1_i1:65-907(-)
MRVVVWCWLFFVSVITAQSSDGALSNSTFTSSSLAAPATSSAPLSPTLRHVATALSTKYFDAFPIIKRVSAVQQTLQSFSAGKQDTSLIMTQAGQEWLPRFLFAICVATAVNMFGRMQVLAAILWTLSPFFSNSSFATMVWTLVPLMLFVARDPRPVSVDRNPLPDHELSGLDAANVYAGKTPVLLAVATFMGMPVGPGLGTVSFLTGIRTAPPYPFAGCTLPMTSWMVGPEENKRKPTTAGDISCIGGLLRVVFVELWLAELLIYLALLVGNLGRSFVA